MAQLAEIGLFNPAESTYMRPGAYDEALRANAFKQASYLSAMDQFYEQLDETVREFNATLSFKEAELAQIKGLTEEQIGLSREQLEINQEQYKSDLALRKEALKAQTEYQTQDIATRRMEINSKYGSLQYSSESPSDKAFDFLNKYTTGGSNQNANGENVKVWQGGGTPTSGQVAFSSADQATIDSWNYFEGVNNQKAVSTW